MSRTIVSSTRWLLKENALFLEGQVCQFVRYRRYCQPLYSSSYRPLLACVGFWQGFSTIGACHAIVVLEETTPTTPVVAVAKHEPSGWKRLRQRLTTAFRLWRRFIKLSVALAPVLALYPLQLLLKPRRNPDEDTHDIILLQTQQKVDGPLGWYLSLCLACVEWSGAAVIKLMQWAGSRPDMFGADFCSVFCRLQDDTTPHAWRYTEQAMKDAYGDNWKDHIQLNQILGSGCIGQVYSGIVTDDDGNQQQVAVKVLHPNVEVDIDSDVELMRLAARFLERFNIVSGLKYLNMEGAIDEFSSLLKLQLDLRNEANHLERFNENFSSFDDVVFPQLIKGYKPTKQVLVETFCDGVPVLQFARQNQDNTELLQELCYTGIRAVCKMIFVDNFLHGDLHPGNVFVSREGNPHHKFIVLDVGMVTEYSDADHRLIVDILTAFIRMDGRRAGELLIDDSNARNTSDQALSEEMYVDKILALTTRAHGRDYFMEHLGTYISYICEAASTHHVVMNQAFVSAALAIKIQEGIALALDPSVDIYGIANPIILQSEFKRRVADAAGRVTKTARQTTTELLQWAGLY